MLLLKVAYQKDYARWAGRNPRRWNRLTYEAKGIKNWTWGRKYGAIYRKNIHLFRRRDIGVYSYNNRNPSLYLRFVGEKSNDIGPDKRLNRDRIHYQMPQKIQEGIILKVFTKVKGAM